MQIAFFTLLIDGRVGNRNKANYGLLGAFQRAQRRQKMIQHKRTNEVTAARPASTLSLCEGGREG